MNSKKKELYNDQRFLQLNLEDKNILKDFGKIKLLLPGTGCLVKVAVMAKKFEKLHLS